MLHPEEDQPVNRSQKSTFKPADSGQFQIGTRTNGENYREVTNSG